MRHEHFCLSRENLERVIYFLLMDRKNKVSYQDDEIPTFPMARSEGKKARLRSFRKFALFDKKLILFFVRCVLLYAAYKLFVFVLNMLINTLNDVKGV